MNYHLPHNGKEQNNPAKLLDICKKTVKFANRTSVLPSFLFRYEVNDNSLYISSISNYAYKKRVDFFLSRSSSSHSLSECLSVPDSLYPPPFRGCLGGGREGDKTGKKKR